MQFLNPAMLAGALLFAVPLVIHLLNRQRHKRRDWAAMEFLLRAWQKTRNRLRNENLLLLLLRCLIPILLAFAIARPTLQHAAALVADGGGTHHVVVLDQSYSMGLQKDGAPSPFDRGHKLVQRLLEQLQARPERSDRVTLVTAGVRPRFHTRQELNLELARARWLAVQRPEDAATDLVPALLQVLDALGEGGDHAEVYVLTDLQARALGKTLETTTPSAPAAPELRDTLPDAVERLQQREHTQLHWIDVGPFAADRLGGTVDNVQVTGLRPDQPIALARLPMTVVATLRNRGQSRATVQVTLEVDGGEPVRKAVALEPGAEGEAEFAVTFRETGRRRLRATVQQDGLDADDAFVAVVDVRDRVRVLVVDGAADDDPLKSYGYFWRGMIDPTSFPGAGAGAAAPGTVPTELSTYEVTTVDTLALLSGQQSPTAYDVTVLADVDRINERAATELERALQQGKGLLVTLGRRVDAASYDLHLFGNGEGPLPMRLAGRLGGRRGTTVERKPEIALPMHPILREFDEDVYREILQQIPVQEWFGTAERSLHEDAEVVLRLSDPDRSPLLVARRHGEGRAAFLTSAPASEYDGDRWNRLEDRFIVHPLLFGLLQWLALPAQNPFAAVVGASLSGSLPAHPVDVTVLLPERLGGGRQPVSEDARPLAGRRYALPEFTGTTMAGIYTVELQLERDTGREPWSEPFAVNVDPEEGLLRYLAHDESRQLLGIAAVLTALPTTATVAADSGDDELGPTLLMLLLALVVGEAALARFVSVRRT